MKIQLSLSGNVNRVIMLLTFLGITALVNAQVVPTNPLPKNFLIEKGSGIACCSCPGITAKCDSIIELYPKGKGFMMVYHFGPDARPQSGQLNKDYRTQFGDSILTPVWPFYLNMMVNRKDRGAPYGSTFIFGASDQISPECAALALETAPVNLAFTSSYNTSTREITVNAKAYYTANSITPINYLQICLTEDSIIGPQCVNSPPFIYTYKHMDLFRANLNGPLGVQVATTSSGNEFTGTYSYILPAKFGTGTDMNAWIAPTIKNLKLVMFMTEDKNGFNTKFGRIQNVISAPLGQGAVSGLDHPIQPGALQIYPNPSKGKFTISSIAPFSGYALYNLNGQMLEQRSGYFQSEVEADFSGIAPGMYLLRIETNSGSLVRRVLIQN